MACLVVIGGNDPASADCTPDSATAQSGDSVSCTGSTPGGFSAGVGVENLFIVVETNGTISNPAAGAAAIEINANNPGNPGASPPVPGVLNLGEIDITGDGSSGVRAVVPSVAGESNFVRNEGTIQNLGAGAGNDVVGIDLGDGARVEHVGTIDLHGERNIGIRVGAAGTVTSGGWITNQDGPVRDDFIGIDAGDGAWITQTDVDQANGQTRGFIDVRGDRSIGIRVGDDARVDNAGTICSSGSTHPTAGCIPGALPGTDKIGILTGERADVNHAGSIQLSGARSVGIEAGDDSLVMVNGNVDVGSLSSLTLSVESVGIRLGDSTGDTGSLTGLIVNASVLSVGHDTRAVEIGSGWLGTNRTIRITPNGLVRARGDDSIGLMVGNDNEVRIEGAVAGLGANAIAVFMGDQLVADPDARLSVTGSVGVAFADAVGVSLGSKAAEFGVDITNSFTPSMELGRLTTPVLAGDPGDLVGAFDSGPLVVFRSATSDLNHLLISDGSRLVADESRFFDPNRGIALRGTDGAERIDVYGQIGGKIFLEGGDDIFMLGPVGTYAGNMNADGGAGFDTLELSNRWGAPIAPGVENDVALGRFRNFERVFIADAAYRVSGRTALVSPGATLRVDDTGKLIVRRALGMGGAIDFGAGSTLRFELNGGSGSTYLESGGAITIEGDSLDGLTSTIEVDVLGAADPGLIVLASGASLSGRFETEVFVPNSYFSVSNLAYDDAAGTITIDLAQTTAFEYNREVTNDYLDAMDAAGAGPEIDAMIQILDGLSTDDYLLAIDTLHPEAYDAQTSVQLALAHQFQQTLLERPNHCIAPANSGHRDPRTKVPCRPRTFDAWTAGYGLFRSRDGEIGHISWNDQGGGGAVGVDHRRGSSWLFSAALGGAAGSSDVDRSGDGQLAAIDAGVLAAWTRGPALVQGFAGYGHGWHDVTRRIAFANVARDTAGSYQSNRYALGGELSWNFALDGFDVRPVFEIDWARITHGGFEESGAGELSLIVDDDHDSVTTVRVGFDVGTSLLKKGYWTDLLERTDGVWQPELSVRWRQVVSGDARGYSSAMAGTPAGVNGTTVYGDDAAQGFEIGAGVWFTPKSATRVSLGASYDAFVWKDVVAQEIMGSVIFSF